MSLSTCKQSDYALKLQIKMNNINKRIASISRTDKIKRSIVHSAFIKYSNSLEHMRWICSFYFSSSSVSWVSIFAVIAQLVHFSTKKKIIKRKNVRDLKVNNVSARSFPYTIVFIEQKFQNGRKELHWKSFVIVIPKRTTTDRSGYYYLLYRITFWMEFIHFGTETFLIFRSPPRHIKLVFILGLIDFRLASKRKMKQFL